MAYLVRRSPDRTEIRESHATPRGPRSRVLASFSGPLTHRALARAAERALRPFDHDAIMRRARALRIPVREHSGEPEARALLSRLRRRDPLDPSLAAALRHALAQQPDAPIPEPLAEVSEWIGASLAERGAALCELLDLYGRIAASREPRRRRTPERARFPRFSSQDKAG
ncbi:hypothetical protein KJ059_18650 [Myxococcota bacterium]|nr:hypothetical protein [Myxococcota bacterium]MCZ7619737.1 hypothetical protein [Myxococcota bacterium]